MTLEHSDLFGAAAALLPGFISAWVYYSLTPSRTPGQFERTIQALIFSAISAAALRCTKQLAFLVCDFGACVGAWQPDLELALGMTYGVLVGAIASYATNSDKLHEWLRDRQLTRRRSFDSEWYYYLASNERYVILNLKDERRIMGWPQEWPNWPDKGHFALSNASWLLEDGSEVRLGETEAILVSADLVDTLEFLKWTEEIDDGQPEEPTRQ